MLLYIKGHCQELLDIVRQLLLISPAVCLTWTDNSLFFTCFAGQYSVEHVAESRKGKSIKSTVDEVSRNHRHSKRLPPQAPFLEIRLTALKSTTA